MPLSGCVILLVQPEVVVDLGMRGRPSALNVPVN